MSEFTHMTHEGTGGTMDVSLVEPGAQEFWEARGWAVADRPAEVPFVPPKVVQRQGDAEFVQLFHTGAGASHMFPNNPDALQGAYEAGWHATPPRSAAAPEPDADAEPEDAEPEDDPTEPPADQQPEDDETDDETPKED